MTTAARAQRRTFSSVAELADACRRLRHTLSGQHQVPEETIAEGWPSDEAKAGWGEWAFAYGQMMRLFGAERGSGERSAHADAERAALAALHREPEPVPMSDGSIEFVHPKGFRTLCWFEDRDTILAEVVALRERLSAGLQSGGLRDAGAGPEELLAAAREREVRALAEMAAQACTPGCRFAAELPAEQVARFADRDPGDLLAVHAAYYRVNFIRPQQARVLAPPRKPAGEKRTASWGGWLAAIAYRERTTVEAISNERSFAELCVTYELAVPGDDELEEMA